MHICFHFTPRDLDRAGQTARRIAGRSGALRILSATDSGPYYPQTAEILNEARYAFFAGQIAGCTPGGDPPSEHAVFRNDAADWTMAEEPDGSWIALKFDRQQDIVSIAGDRFLLQRWYYAERDGGWYFANSLVFLAAALKTTSLNAAAVPYMLLLGYLPGQLTPLADVYGLRSGQILTITGGKPAWSQRTRLPVTLAAKTNSASDAESTGVLTALQHATAQALRNVGDVFIPLSGGMDSRFLLGCALDVLPRERITTITFGHPHSLDYRIGSGLARHLGVRNIALPLDESLLPDRLNANFTTAEGMYWTYPDYPVTAMRAVLPPGAHVLSGYIGDVVFGSYDPPPGTFDGPNAQDELQRRIMTKTRVCDERQIADLLPDAPATRNLFAHAGPAATGTYAEQYLLWIFENHQMNRTNFALQAHRDRAIYLAPFVYGAVLKTAFALAPALRQNERALFAAMQRGYPDLYDYPTKRNGGYPLTAPRTRTLLRRGWRKLWATLDERIGALLGVELYHHPMNNFHHPREIQRRSHREYLSAALTELRALPLFRADALERLRERVLKSQPVDSNLLRGLLTVHQWQVQYLPRGRAERL